MKNECFSPVFAGLARSHGHFYLTIKAGHKYQTITLPVIKNDKALLSWLEDYSKKQGFKIIAMGLAGFGNFESLGTSLWQDLDIVPQPFFNNKQITKDDAQKACRLISKRFDDKLKPLALLGKKREIKPQFLTNLDAYQKVSTKKDWQNLLQAVKACRQNNLRITFINSTPAGGGVALMRHALMRLYERLGVEVKWLVMTPDREVFNITKKKFHNVLQGIAPADIILTDNDKVKYNNWIKKNFKLFKPVLEKTDVIIDDDPQPSGLLPLIKKYYPDIKIIYRSHIQIYSYLIDKGVTQNRKTWDFIWENASLADLFISHPIASFVPKDVPSSKVLYLPATTDPLDGLNKPLSSRQKDYYFQLFNDILIKEGVSPLNCKRPYIIQVARFDPSKGIDDVLESYRQLRKKMIAKKTPLSKTPQLLIVGNGADDDPECLPIYQKAKQIIKQDSYALFRDDIKIAHLSHNDQLLNTLLRGATIALQLSHREGFEIKVTEALMKGVPVIAYNVGGIPLQIENGKNGYLVALGNTSQVAALALQILEDKAWYKKMSLYAKSHINQTYLTVHAAYRWLFLSLILVLKSPLSLKSHSFSDLEKRYKHILK